MRLIPHAVLTAALLAAGGASAMDETTAEALAACDTYVRDFPIYANLPDEQIAVLPHEIDATTILVNWHVSSPENSLDESGTCTVQSGEVTEFEDQLEEVEGDDPNNG